MSAFARELATRNARIDALLHSDDRRQLASAISQIELVARLIREGNPATELLADTLDRAERDVQAVLDGMEADHV